MRLLVLLSVLALGTASMVRAQSPLATQPLDSGAVVRVWLGPDESIYGPLLERFTPSASVLTLCRRPGLPCLDSAAVNRRTIRTAAIRELEVYRPSGNALRGAAVGAVVGLVGGLAGRAVASGLRDTDAPLGYGAVLWTVIAGVVGGAFAGHDWNAWHPAP